MDKQLIDRLVVVYENLRDIGGDLMMYYGKQQPPTVETVGRFTAELDVLETLIDGLQQEIKQ